MLDWLSIRSHKTDHPMYSIEEAERLLTGLSDEPLKALEEITSWLTTLTQAAGFHPAVRLAVIKLVDEAGRPFEPELTLRYLKPRAHTEFERRQLWDAALQYWERLAQAYRLCLDSMRPKGGLPRAPAAEVALVIVRALRASGGQARLLHLRYMPVRDEWWQKLFDLYALSEAAGCDTHRVTAYPGEALQTNARQELLRAMLLETARPASMLVRHTDLAARVAARYADACLFDSKPRDACNWAFDLALPRPPELATQVAPEPSTVRYYGAGAVTTKLREVIRRLTAEPHAKELRFGEDYSTADKLFILQRLVHYWGESPPQLSEKRAGVDAEIEVALGFAPAWQRIPRVHYRDWRALIASLDLPLLERLGITAEPVQLPAPEKWTQRDVSTWGMSAVVTLSSEAELTIGTLCVLKTSDGPWSVGAVRRLFRDGEGRTQAGIEVLAKKPATLLLRRVGHGGLSVQNWSSAAEASGSDYVNVLLLAHSRAEKERHELLIARGEFIAGIIYEAMIGDAKQHFKFEELLEQGVDFDRVRFTRVSRTSDPATTA